MFLEFSGFYILSNLQLSRFFVVGLFSSNFYILSQSFVFVNNFFNFFISYSLALLVLTAAQEISYQMFRQMSTIIYNFFYKPFYANFFTQYSPCIRTGCINQLHGFIGSGSALTDCACFNYISEGIPSAGIPSTGISSDEDSLSSSTTSGATWNSDRYASSGSPARYAGRLMAIPSI